MNTFWCFVTKETRHILRDSRTMMVLFGMPVVLMLLLGFALKTEVRNVRVVAVTASADHLTHDIIDRLDASDYFMTVATVGTPREAELLIRSRRADMAVVFSPDFASRTVSGKGAGVQLMLDCSDPNMAIQQANYARQIITAELSGSSNVPSPVTIKMLYNPGMESSYGFVPGIMGMLLLIVCAMMTSVSIVREKERGTMETLLVSPVRPYTIIVAKAVPYAVLSFVIVTCILLIARFVLGVPVEGSLLSIYGVSAVYVMLALSLGLLISVLVSTQIAAMLASGMLLLMPSMLLSGMIFPVESMPEVLQWVAAVVPARWYIEAMRKLMIMGTGIDSVADDVVVLAAMTVVLLTVALKKFNTRLG